MMVFGKFWKIKKMFHLNQNPQFDWNISLPQTFVNKVWTVGDWSI